MFVNRQAELDVLTRWWAEGDARARVALVWGRRRVGKSELLREFIRRNGLQSRSVFHIGAGRPEVEELRLLSRSVRRCVEVQFRDLDLRPFTSWDDALETIAAAAADVPLLVVLDEFPELLTSTPALDNMLRAFLERIELDGVTTRVRFVLCGSAVRTMEALQEERSPLHGRAGVRLQVHPFEPWEAARMLERLTPGHRALVWGLVGGVPLYLSWWDATAGVSENLARLVCMPGARLLTEADFVLATEAGRGGLPQLVLRAIAGGHTKYQEIASVVRSNPTRTLDSLIRLRLVERVAPVTEDPRRTKRSYYRVADNFLAFSLGLVDRFRPDIDQGLGPGILKVLTAALDDYMGDRWEDAYRRHLRRLAAQGHLGDDIVAVGPFWNERGQDQLDVVALAGRGRRAVFAGEAKWARSLNGGRIAAELRRKATALDHDEALRYGICARDAVTGAGAWTPTTAADIFA